MHLTGMAAMVGTGPISTAAGTLHPHLPLARATDRRSRAPLYKTQVDHLKQDAE